MSLKHEAPYKLAWEEMALSRIRYAAEKVSDWLWRLDVPALPQGSSTRSLPAGGAARGETLPEPRCVFS